MREHHQIVERWREGSASILATLVRVQGSSYRQPGARLVVNTDGSYHGAISAGCLEADLLRKAAWLTREGPAMERYSTVFDETAEMPFGLGCGGVLDVLLEPVGSPECQALLQAMERTLAGCEHHVATWLPADCREVQRAVFRTGGEVVFTSPGLTPEALSEALLQFLSGGDLELPGAFLERLVPPQRLFVFGAGDDAKPLVTMACLMGWSVTVVDGRGHLARKTRFPERNASVVAKSGDAVAQINARDAVVIMTHSYEQDRHYLTAVLPLRPRYLGLLGSRQRSSLLIAEVAPTLELSVSECCGQISAPIGLDLGGEGPEAIALAIIAEAQASCAGRRNDARKLSDERVHQYLANADVQRYVQAQCAIGTI